ncbi:TKL protein kinase [Saprolegnia diclina VS20]|uniref:TKL protein kinase n=1 Tax=Saprolegnia diclina (strain VS20) TaxID=1156394 RepID=T0PWE4_SAPDV|nr:TKL protein kinase [Saprolegnia diclina VS20]EQC29849.1 TKL protein kinase [Saprolegnia diclina VS20]|eukprot:XP_008616688.1 TKL protein kinase [Saprolegnia diclina VS20]
MALNATQPPAVARDPNITAVATKLPGVPSTPLPTTVRLPTTESLPATAAIEFPLTPSVPSTNPVASPTSNDTQGTTAALALAITCPVVVGIVVLYMMLVKRCCGPLHVEPSPLGHLHTLSSDSYELTTRETVVPQLDARQLRLVRLLAPPSDSFQVYFGTYYAGNGSLDVAVKRLTPWRQTDHEFVLQFIEHIHLLSRLRHANIVAVVGVVWHHQFNAEVAFEFLSQGSLRDLLTTTNPLTVAWPDKKHQLALDVLLGLTYLHSQDVLHQQLTMDAVLLTTSVHRVTAKIASIPFQRDDCLFSRTSASSSVSSSSSRWSDVLRQTTTYVSCRISQSPQTELKTWVAPEVLRGEKPTAASDMYSFGVLLSVLDSHEDPYKHHLAQMDNDILLQRISHGTLRPTLSVLCPPGITELALACLESNPLDRPTGARAIAYLEAPPTSFTSSRSVSMRQSPTIVL